MCSRISKRILELLRLTSQSVDRLEIGIFQFDPIVEGSNRHRKNFLTKLRPISVRVGQICRSRR